MPVNRAGPRAGHRNTPPAKRYRTLLRAVAHGGPIASCLPFAPQASVISASNIAANHRHPGGLAQCQKALARRSGDIAHRQGDLFGRIGHTTASVVSASQTVGTVFIAVPFLVGVLWSDHPRPTTRQGSGGRPFPQIPRRPGQPLGRWFQALRYGLRQTSVIFWRIAIEALSKYRRGLR
jgi:hypothetical protein